MHDVTVRERFMAKTNTDGPLPTWAPFLGPCWVWTAGRSDTGYGAFSVAGRLVGAHRVSYEIHVGPIPVGLVLDHLCRVRSCVNPAHLEPVTRLANFGRGFHALHPVPDTHCKQGHEWTEENTWRSPSDPSYRKCRACQTARR